MSKRLLCGWFLFATLFLGGCVSQVRLLRPLQPGTIEITRPGVYRIDTVGKDYATCKLYQGRKLLAINNTRGTRKNCRLIQYLSAGRYRLHVKPMSSSKVWLSVYNANAQLRVGLPYTLSFRRIQDKRKQSSIPAQVARLQITKGGLHEFSTQNLSPTLPIFDKQGHNWNPSLPARGNPTSASSSQRFHVFLPPGQYLAAMRAPKPTSGRIRISALSTRTVTSPFNTNKRLNAYRSHAYSFRVQKPTLMSFQAFVRSKFRSTIRGTTLHCKLFDHTKGIIYNLRARGRCSFMRALKPGQYTFHLTSPQTRDYALRIGPKPMKSLRSNKRFVPFATRASSPPLFFRFRIKQRGVYIIRSLGRTAPSCGLYTHTFRPLGWSVYSKRKSNCLLRRRLRPGLYYLRLQSRSRWRQVGSLGLLHPRKLPQINLQKTTVGLLTTRSSVRYYRLYIPKRTLRVFQIRARRGNAHCILRDMRTFRAVAAKLGRRSVCQLRGRFAAGNYILQVVRHPRTRVALYAISSRTYTSQRIQPGSPLSGSLHRTARVLYSFRNPKAGFYLFETSGANVDSRCWVLHTTKKRMRSLSYDNDSGQGYNCRLLRFLPPGRYIFYLRAGPRQASTSTPFSARLRAFPLNPTPLKLNKTTAALQWSKPLHAHKLTISKASLYLFETKGSSDPTCTLYNSSLRRIGSHNDLVAKKDRNCRLIAYLHPGSFIFTTTLADKQFQQQPFQVSVKPYTPKQALRVGRPFQAAALTSEKPDFYKLNIRKAGLYRIESQGNSDPACFLYTQELLLIKSNNNIASSARNCRILRYLTPGKYIFYVSLASRRHTGHPYTLQLTREAPPTHTPERPIPIPPLQASSAHVLRLKVKTPGIYRLRTLGRSSPQCYIYDATYSILASSEKRSKRPQNCRITRGLAKGTYYIRIGIYNPRFAGQRMELSIKRLPFLQPKPLALNRLTYGGALRPGLLHYFHFRAPKSGIYQFATTGKSDPYCYLLNPKYRVVGRNDDSGDIVRTRSRSPYQQGAQSHTRYQQDAQSLLDEAPRGRRPPRKTPRTKRYRRYRRYRRSRRPRIQRDKNCRVVEYLKKGQRYTLRVQLAGRQYAGRLYRVSISQRTGNLRKVALKRTLAFSGLPKGQTHFFRFRIPQPGLYLIKTSGKNDPKCYLHDKDMAWLAYSNNISSSKNPKARNLNCRFYHLFARRGTHYLKVRLARYGRSDLPYQLRIEKLRASQRIRRIRRERRPQASARLARTTSHPHTRTLPSKPKPVAPTPTTPNPQQQYPEPDITQQGSGGPGPDL